MDQSTNGAQQNLKTYSIVKAIIPQKQNTKQKSDEKKEAQKNYFGYKILQFLQIMGQYHPLYLHNLGTQNK